MKLLIPFYLLIVLLQNATHAAVVVGTSHIREGFIGSNSFSIDQEFSSSDGTGFIDYTGFGFNSLGGNDFEYGGSALDEGVSVFFVDSNNAFSETNILGGEFIELLFGTTYTLPSNFFVGLRTPVLDSDSTLAPAYGWAEMGNSGGELSLVDHAVAYCSQGIFVNTITPIPEPSCLTLGSVALTSLLLKRRRGRRRRGGPTGYRS